MTLPAAPAATQGDRRLMLGMLAKRVISGGMYEAARVHAGLSGAAAWPVVVRYATSRCSQPQPQKIVIKSETKGVTLAIKRRSFQDGWGDCKGDRAALALLARADEVIE